MNMNKQKKTTYYDQIAILFLILYPLRHVNLGIDIMDAGYALGNYRFFDSMNPTWKFATYLSNVTGAALMKLPRGNTWYGMNVYTGLLLSAMAVFSYLIVCKIFSAEGWKKRAVLLSELVAISLCWAPTTVLYHYLGYYLFSIAAMILYFALMHDNASYYLAAGVLLGLGVLVRMPNITYTALILTVWYGLALKKKKTFVKTTGYCLTGFLLGFLPVFLFISIKYGFATYPDMIQGLFGMTETATDYKPTAMLMAMFGDYIVYSSWLLIYAAYFFVGYFFYRYLYKKLSKAMQILSKTVYVLGGLLLVRFSYGRGMFGLDYQDFFAIYKIETVYLLLAIILCVYCILSKKAEDNHKLLSAFLLVIIMITPLGSNNGLYPIMNNMFIVAPVITCLAWDRLTPKWTNFAVKYMVLLFGTLFLVQSTAFGISYCFHDYAKESRVMLNITDTVSTQNMYTTVDKSSQLEELGAYLTENELKDKQVLLYKQIPAISYIFDLKPAIYTTWIDLDSNPLANLKADLEKVDVSNMMIICSTQEIPEEKLSNACREKYAYIQAFMEQNNYICTFENSGYRVYLVK